MAELADVYKRRREKILNLRAKNETMSSRERAIKAINHEEADRIPIDIWVVPEIQKRMMEHWDDYCAGSSSSLDTIVTFPARS